MAFAIARPVKYGGTQMTIQVDVHYAGTGDLAGKIAQALRSAGKDLDDLSTSDLATIHVAMICRS